MSRLKSSGSGDMLDEDFNYLSEDEPRHRQLRAEQSSNQASYFRSIDEDYYGFTETNDASKNALSGLTENEIILDGETQIRFLGNIRVWQLAATFLLGCVLLMFVLIVIVKLINKLQKEKYLMLFMMEAKLGELEKKSYTLLKNGLNQSMERISSISSRFKMDYLRRSGKKNSVASNLTNTTTPSTLNSSLIYEDDDECRLSARDLAFTNQCFKLDEFDASSSQLPCDSFA